MSLRLHRLAALAVLVALSLCTARADDADAVKEKLYQAKKTYDVEVQKFRNIVGDTLEKREADARKAGKKALLEQIKDDRDRFDNVGEPPSDCPKAALAQVTAARAKLDKAYAAAIKDFVKSKEDAAAEAIEKEHQKFLFATAFTTGKRTYLTTLKPSEIKVWNGMFEKDTDRFKMGESKVPHSLFMHPDSKADAVVSFPLPPKSLLFRATLGVPKHDDKQIDPASALTFEVLGDGKSLWKSEPITKLDTFQTCEVKVEKVKTLTLSVHCQRDHTGAHAVWFAPTIAE